MIIEITEETANAIVLIENRYYFDLFKEIRTLEKEEYIMRDAIFEIAKEIKLRGVTKWKSKYFFQMATR